jgi:hypothetical protein
MRLREVDIGADLGDQLVLHARAQPGALIRVAPDRPAERGDAVEVARGAAALGRIGPAWTSPVELTRSILFSKDMPRSS